MAMSVAVVCVRQSVVGMFVPVIVRMAVSRLLMRVRMSYCRCRLMSMEMHAIMRVRMSYCRGRLMSMGMAVAM